jgi:8-hydroxy-5-deazaflavin:NADPH oxidoreductase
MTTAIIGTGGIGSAMARQLVAGGDTLQLSTRSLFTVRRSATQTTGGRATLPAGDTARGVGPSLSGPKLAIRLR